MKLEDATTRKAFHFEDKGGYRFTIDAVKDPEFGGWDVSLSMHTSGMKTAEDGVRHLRHSAEAFLRQLAEME